MVRRPAAMRQPVDIFDCEDWRAAGRGFEHRNTTFDTDIGLSPRGEATLLQNRRRVVPVDLQGQRGWPCASRPEQPCGRRG